MFSQLLKQQFMNTQYLTKKNKLKYLHMFTLIDNQSKCTTLPCCTIEGGAAGWYLVIKTTLTVSPRSIPKM